MEVVINQQLRRVIPLVKVLSGLLIMISLAVILVEGREILMPVALAVLFSFSLAPISSFFERLGASRGVAVGICMLLVAALLGGMAYVTYTQVTSLAAELPQYAATIKAKVKNVTDAVLAEGPVSRAIGVVTSILTEAADEIAQPGKEAVVIVKTAQPSFFETLVSRAGPLLSPLATAGIVIILTGFMLAGREDLRNRLIKLAGTTDIHQTTAVIDEAGARVSGQLLAQLGLNLAFGIVTGAGLWLIGLPSPFLWGMIVGLMRFVPYIGGILGSIAPLLLAFAYDPTWVSFLYTLALLIGLDAIVGQFVEPALYGRSAGVSPLALIISAMIWAYLWGPIGLVLAAPLTICIVVMSRYVESFGFLDTLLGDKPVLLPHEIFYQRVLAGDELEVTGQAEHFLERRSLVTYFDAIALQGLRSAQLDYARGHIDASRVKEITKTLLAAFERLSKWRRRGSRRLRPEAEAAFESIKDDAILLRATKEKIKLPADWRSPAPGAILFGEHPLDEAAAAMLAQVLRQHGLPVVVRALKVASASSPEEIAATKVVFLSFVEPLATVQLRAAVMGVHRRSPGIAIVVCVWQETDAEFVRDLARKLNNVRVVTTTAQALSAAYEAALRTAK